MKRKLTSRKFLVAVVGATALIVKELADIDIDVEATVGVVLLLTAYIFGEGFADGMRRRS